MQPRFPREPVKWQQFVEQLLLQHHVDIQRLWKRAPGHGAFPGEPRVNPPGGDIPTPPDVSGTSIVLSGAFPSTSGSASASGPGSGSSSPLSGSSQFCLGGDWRDSFTDADDTPLGMLRGDGGVHEGEHTPGGYYDDAWGFIIEGDKAKSVAAGTIRATFNPDHDITDGYRIQFLVAFPETAAFEFMRVNDENYFDVHFSTTGGVSLRRWSGGVATTLDSGSFAITANEELIVVIEVAKTGDVRVVIEGDAGKIELHTGENLPFTEMALTSHAAGTTFDSLCVSRNAILSGPPLSGTPFSGTDTLGTPDTGGETPDTGGTPDTGTGDGNPVACVSPTMKDSFAGGTDGSLNGQSPDVGGGTWEAEEVTKSTANGWAAVAGGTAGFMNYDVNSPSMLVYVLFKTPASGGGPHASTLAVNAPFDEDDGGVSLTMTFISDSPTVFVGDLASGDSGSLTWAYDTEYEIFIRAENWVGGTVSAIIRQVSNHANILTLSFVRGDAIENSDRVQVAISNGHPGDYKVLDICAKAISAP